MTDEPISNPVTELSEFRDYTGTFDPIAEMLNSYEHFKVLDHCVQKSRDLGQKVAFLL